MVMSRIAVVIVSGVAVGIACAFLAVRALDRFLYGVGPTDSAAFLGAVIAMIVAALVACVLPTRRALRIDPVSAMRIE